MAHNDTVFAQVLKLVPRHEFESLARKHKSGRMSRSMTRWGQFVAMGMAQLTGRCSLRDIVSNLAAQSCKLYHLGVGVVTRSSLARVNAEKPWEMYEELHGRLLGRCQAKAPGHGYRFKAKLFSVDSTTIDLCLSAFPWAKFRRTKGAVKVHVGLDHEGYLPTFVRVTNGKTSDIEAARALTLPKGSIVAADRAYVDFAWIDSLISGSPETGVGGLRRFRKATDRAPAALGSRSARTVNRGRQPASRVLRCALALPGDCRG